MRFKSIFITVALVMLSSAASAEVVDIYGWKSIAGVEFAQRASYFSWKFCKTGTNYCAVGSFDNNGWGRALADGGFYYDLYMYYDYGFTWNGYQWGSMDVPIAGGPFYVYQTPYGQGVSASVPPRPLPPDPVAPCDGCSVPRGNFYLKWTDGLDADRETTAWPVTYEIWASATPVGWPNQPEQLLIPDAPCNPDASGNCQWYVDTLDDMPGCHYTWHIVAKLNVGGGVVYTTSGPSWDLYQQY